VSETATATALYAYAVVGPVTERLRNELGDRLELVGDDEVAVVTGEVPLADYGTEVLPERLNDRAWLESAATEHEGVVRRLLGSTAVVPLRFGSIHHDRASVERFLQARRAEFAATLERVRGLVEVGVKVWLEPRDRAAEPEAPLPASGREYLERRKQERDRAAAASGELDDRLRGIHERLAAVAEAAALNRPQARELTGADREMVLNAAYLVATDDEALRAEVERLRSENADLAFEVTGPWAPYNFVGGADQ